MPLSLEQRFWSKVERRSADECWPWTGGATRGRGAIRHQGRQLIAPRVSWIIANAREIPDGLCVCHSCDNPLCVNPGHLWVGTQRDNIQDMYAKGRNNNGRGGRGYISRPRPLSGPVQTWPGKCRYGHPYAGQPSYPSEVGKRRCYICHRGARLAGVEVSA